MFFFRHKIEPFLKRIVTCSKKWILYDNKQRSPQWLDADEQYMAKPNLKNIMIWWNMSDIIHYSFLESGQTNTVESYCRKIAFKINNKAAYIS